MIGPQPGDITTPQEQSEVDRKAQSITDTDLANARLFASQHGKNLRYTVARGWLVWDGTRWAVDANGLRAQEFAKQMAETLYDSIKGSTNEVAAFRHARNSQSRKAIEAVSSLAKSDSAILVPVTDFDCDSSLFNVRNGVIDTRTCELRSHRREDLITKIADVEFQPAAECDQWDKFVWSITDKNRDLYDYLQRLVGYLLVGDTSEQSIYFLYGLGANGKSVFCEVLSHLLGEYAQTASPDLLMIKKHASIPNDIARLHGARLCSMNETAQGARFDEAKLKDLTGGDTLTGRFLKKEFFDYRPTFRLLIRGNHKPKIEGQDIGIWRRLHLIPFTVSFPPNQQDRNLLSKLLKELPGILQWALKGCASWRAGGLQPPAVVTEAVRSYREESDVLGRFIEERCEQGKLDQVKSSSFFSQYQKFAESAGERWMPARDLKSDMERRGFTWKRINSGSVYLGIGLRVEEIGNRWGGEG